MRTLLTITSRNKIIENNKIKTKQLKPNVIVHNLMIPGPTCTSVYLLLTLPHATVHLMLAVLSVRGRPGVNKPATDFAALTLTVTCGGAHTGKQTMNQQHANSGTETDGQLETAAL